MRFLHKRKVTKEGRVNIPIEFLEQFKIQEDDSVSVTANKQCIMIRKFKDTNVCAITGKTGSRMIRVGEVSVSNEGLDLLKKAMEDKA